MKRLYFILSLCLASAVGLLLGADWRFLALGAIGAALIVVGVSRQEDLLAHAGFGLLIVAAAFSAWAEVFPLVMLTSVCASLAAWDIAFYILLLRRVGVAANGRTNRRRFLRLAVALAIGWISGAVALTIQMSWKFGIILMLAFFVIFGLSFSIFYLSRQDENVL